VTFLFTDIEGSTRRWESDADAMRSALLAHDEVLRTAIESHGGFRRKSVGMRSQAPQAGSYSRSTGEPL
jgi:class 3 adenylate cyclase